MKKLALIAAAVLISTPVLAADAVFGTWKTKPDDNGDYGHVKVSQCGNKICGVLVKSFHSDGQSYASESDGKNII